MYKRQKERKIEIKCQLGSDHDKKNLGKISREKTQRGQKCEQGK